MHRVSIVGHLCVRCGATIGASVVCPGCGWIDPMTKAPPVEPRHMISVEKVEEIFNAWVEDLTRNHGDRTVADVLTSPAILSMFSGDVDQSGEDVQA